MRHATAAVHSDDYEAARNLAEALLETKRLRMTGVNASAQGSREQSSRGHGSVIWAGTGGAAIDEPGGNHDEVLLCLARKRRPKLKLRYGFDLTAHSTPFAWLFVGLHCGADRFLCSCCWWCPCV